MSRDMTNTATETILVRLNGPDHPGITAALMDILGSAGAGLEDVEQVIIRGRLSLSLIINVPTGRDLVKELLLFAWEQKMEIDFDVIREVSSAPRPDLVVTMVGSVIYPLEFGAIASVIAAAGSNIDRIVRLAKEPVMAYELVLSGGDADAVRRNLLATAKDLRCDVAVHREGIGRRASRLVVMDVDSTLIRKEMIDLIAERAGTAAEVAEITDRAMRGELDFEQSLRDRVLLLKGLPATVLAEVAEEIQLTPGARTFVRTLKALGYRTAIVSGGFTVIADLLGKQLDIDHAVANTLEVHNGLLTGQLTGAIIDREEKAAVLRKLAALEGVPLEQVVAVGDGANDLDMLDAAGLGIAFNAKPIVQSAADTSLSVPYLDAVLFLLGVRRDHIEQI